MVFDLLIKSITITWAGDDATPKQRKPFSCSNVVRRPEAPIQPTIEFVNWLEEVIGLERENSYAFCNMILTEDWTALLDMGYDVTLSYERYLPAE